MAKQRKKLSSNTVSVLESIAEGRSYEQILALNPQLTYLDIFTAAREALVLDTETAGETVESLTEIREVHPRAYEKWTPEEVDELTRMLGSGRTVDEIAARLQRQPSAVRSRMLRLNLMEQRD